MDNYPTEETDITALTDFEILVDPQVDIYEREVYTLLDFFVELGGFAEILMITGHIFLSIYNKAIGKVSMMNKISKTFAHSQELKFDNGISKAATSGMVLSKNHSSSKDENTDYALNRKVSNIQSKYEYSKLVQNKDT